MRAALDGLAGIFSIEIDLSRDAFRVTYDRSRVDSSAMLGAINSLGFRPRIDRASSERTSRQSGAGTLPPPPVAAMLARGRAEGRPLMLRFHAEWCLPCRTLEATTLSNAAVRQALEQYFVLRVDADADPEAGDYYRINALPTILILDCQGKELARFEGIITADRLEDRLNAIASMLRTSQAGPGNGTAAPVLIVPIVLLPTDPGG